MSFLLLVIIVSAIAGCSHGFMGHDWENNTDIIKINGVLCNNQTRPTPQQWTAYLECCKPCNQTKPPGHEKFAEKMKEEFLECTKEADDVKNLKTNIEEQDKYILMHCSKKSKDCFKAKREKMMKEREEKKDEPEGQKLNKEEMMNKFKDQLNCKIKAFNIV